jgi:hypothetical protein
MNSMLQNIIDTAQDPDVPKIYFTFEKEEYCVDQSAYVYNKIQLPDQRMLSVHGWLESYPPQPMGITVIENTEGLQFAVATKPGKEIVLSFEGQDYLLGREVYKYGRVLLPDDRILQLKKWDTVLNDDCFDVVTDATLIGQLKADGDFAQADLPKKPKLKM